MLVPLLSAVTVVRQYWREIAGFFIPVVFCFGDPQWYGLLPVPTELVPKGQVWAVALSLLSVITLGGLTYISYGRGTRLQILTWSLSLCFFSLCLFGNFALFLFIEQSWKNPSWYSEFTFHIFEPCVYGLSSAFLCGFVVSGLRLFAVFPPPSVMDIEPPRVDRAENESVPAVARPETMAEPKTTVPQGGSVVGTVRLTLHELRLQGWSQNFVVGLALLLCGGLILSFITRLGYLPSFLVGFAMLSGVVARVFWVQLHKVTAANSSNKPLPKYRKRGRVQRKASHTENRKK
jgi:hypothetical protein